MASARSLSHQRALYRTLLRLYPRSFRKGYGEPMAQLFDDQLRLVGTKVWLRTVPDLARTAPIERTDAMARLGFGARALVLALVVLGATFVSIFFGGGAVPIVAVAVVGLPAAPART